ncbi:hypothetical protein HNY73_020224 [Argiope bruennichi]|uniref:Uncharacterized protein n=1 Tax=Argiope bruennichi TaxID=94029 RepID=A0A8T0E7D5_ARGBR|nr:hypothetical protein HNY73_020224 [Argiope bruennichi]
MSREAMDSPTPEESTDKSTTSQTMGVSELRSRPMNLEPPIRTQQPSTSFPMLPMDMEDMPVMLDSDTPELEV